MKKIVFFVPKMVGAGAERTVLNIINNLDRTKFSITLIVSKDGGAYINLLNKDVKLIKLDSIKVYFSILPLAKKLRKLNPDIVFATPQNANIALALAHFISCIKGSMILRESNNRTAAGIDTKRLFDRFLCWSYKRANRVVCLSKGVMKDVINRYNIPKNKVITIYNPIDISNIKKLLKNDPEGCPWLRDDQKKTFKIIATGRLIPQKGFDILIKSLFRLKDIPWTLCILGEGREKHFIQNLAAQLGIFNRIFMPGFVNNPYAWMKCADLFVLSSRWEGFGHVIAEAMVCGTPVLATKCPSGPEEIINNNIDGLLCEPNSVEDLASKIKWLYENPDIRKKYSQVAKESVKRFDVKNIIKEYEELFNELV